jgi:ParB family chromosome partitioning protein
MASVQLVPIEKIRDINSRSRNKTKFREIVENISRVGLKKPITVSRRDGEDGVSHLLRFCSWG